MDKYSNNNNEIYAGKTYRFILEHPLKIDDLFRSPDVIEISKWKNEDTDERIFILKKIEIK